MAKHTFKVRKRYGCSYLQRTFQRRRCTCELHLDTVRRSCNYYTLIYSYLIPVSHLTSYFAYCPISRTKVVQESGDCAAKFL